MGEGDDVDHMSRSAQPSAFLLLYTSYIRPIQISTWILLVVAEFESNEKVKIPPTNLTTASSMCHTLERRLSVPLDDSKSAMKTFVFI